ncbi:hypothetical protein OE88DRAFT_1662476 [Heliocybe sulcata]|uniref:Transcription initiation factor IIF subunit beta n=1 Tax=Heliocybe sulcata TaxID=5364 RepID=A0A5C3N177_9AGAM|nr:hypothetical protein OE88DRAFT_1662476 [Heliocybe sulcata]
MDDVVMDDEKKPFDAEQGAQEEETQPDPNETLMVDAAAGRVWLVKIPKHIMERWSRIDADNIELASLRIYEHGPGESPYITLHLPPDPATGAQGDIFILEMGKREVQNQIVVAEREQALGSRARTTIMTGRVAHECNMKPVFNESYRERMRARHRHYNEPKRSIQRIEESVSGGQGMVNMLSSGAVPSGFSDLVSTKQRVAKGQFERMARMPRNQLLDLLFNLFRERPQWSIRVLRERTQQPEAYLKEVLSEIASLHRSGEFSGLWELKSSFKDDGVKPEGAAGSSMHTDLSQMPPDSMKDEDDDEDEDEDDDEDDDMEEVS